jgi:hypothetical protein
MTKGKIKRNNRELEFMQRQREQSLAKYKVPKKKKKKELPIKVKPFKGITEINPVNLSDYSDLVHAVNRVISPSKNLKKAVACFMINLLLKHSDIYQPGKSYSRMERQYTRDQLRIFRDALSAVEVSFDIIYQGDVGRFPDKRKNYAQKLTKLIQSDLWEGEGNYNIVYVRELSDVIPEKGGFYAEEIAEEIVGKRYEDRLKEIEAYSPRIKEEGSEELEEILKAQGIALDKDATEEENVETITKAIRQYLNGDPDIPGPQKETLTKFVEVTDFMIQAEKEIQEEMKNLVDEKGIIIRLCQNVKPNGILILEGSKIEEIPGLRLVDSYDNIRLYQKS